MAFRRNDIDAGIAHLNRADPVVRTLIRQVGPFRMRLNRNRFGMLVRSIVAQQISTAAARAVRLRLEQAAGEGGLTPENLGRLSFDELRAVGLSQQKAAYITDLTQRTLDGQIHFRRFGRMSDEEIIAELTQVKGIGRWTAQMFLMFSLGRLDVFPWDDFGIRSALRNLYGLEDLPVRVVSCRIAEPWRPYATIASWYCWRSLDLAAARTAAGEAPI